MSLNLLMLGPPGAGKGTQAERFAQSRRIPRISTGDILREAVQSGTEIGLRAKAIMDRGELVSDEVMIGIVRERLDRPDARPGFVLDGFPRTVAQAAALDAIMAGRDPLIIVDIDVPEADLVRRLASRMICPRTTPYGPSGYQAVVRERLKVYHRQSEPLIEYYRSRPTFRSIDGTQSPDRVAADMAAAIEAVGNGGGVAAPPVGDFGRGGLA